LRLSTVGTQASDVLTDKDGMTLYTYDKDEGGIPSCYYGCARMWPPYVGQKGDKRTKAWKLVKREAGDMQWTYNGKPLYFFAEDRRRGEAKGNGIEGLWHVVRK
jgi:predicted lipoprotein with Yx(FWY)xxD motif